MNTLENKLTENKTQSVAHSISNKRGKKTFHFIDNRPEAKVQTKQIGKIESGLKMVQLKSLHSENKIDTLNGKNARLQTIAEKENRQNYSTQRKKNNTGLPDNLKDGIENLSNYSMNDVKVHYNSDKPAQLQAHAFAQGENIYLGPGQEKYLPHEAWHVVQQKQERVRSTFQMKENVSVNDEVELEREADVMGALAANLKVADTTLAFQGRSDHSSESEAKHNSHPSQENHSALGYPVVQRVQDFTNWFAAQAPPPATLAQRKIAYINVLNADYVEARAFMHDIPHGIPVQVILNTERGQAFQSVNQPAAAAAFNTLARWVTRILEIKQLFGRSRAILNATTVNNRNDQGKPALRHAIGQLNGVTALNLQAELDTIYAMAVLRTDAQFDAMDTTEFLAYQDTTIGEGNNGAQLGNAPNGLPIYSIPFEDGQLPSALMNIINNVRANVGVVGDQYGFHQGVRQNRSVATHTAGDMRSWHDDEANALPHQDLGGLSPGGLARRGAYEALYLAEFRSRTGQQTPLLERNDAELLARLGAGADVNLRSDVAATRKAAFVAARGVQADAAIQTHHEKGFIEINADGWNQASQLGRILYDYRNDRFFLTGGHYNNFKVLADGSVIRETDDGYAAAQGVERNHAFHIAV